MPFFKEFRSFLEQEVVKTVRPPPRSPSLYAYAERFVRTIERRAAWIATIPEPATLFLLSPATLILLPRSRSTGYYAARLYVPRISTFLISRRRSAHSVISHLSVSASTTVIRYSP